MQYRLIRSKRRKRSASLRVTKEGQIEVRAPMLMPKFFIDRFVSSKSGWIAKQIKLSSQPVIPLVQHRSVLELKRLLDQLVLDYTQKTGLRPVSIRLRLVKSYWGSCSPQGVISFSQRLVYAPAKAVEYVVVHELCHLKLRGHGPKFWALVNHYFPQSNEMRRLLRQIGRE